MARNGSCRCLQTHDEHVMLAVRPVLRQAWTIDFTCLSVLAHMCVHCSMIHALYVPRLPSHVWPLQQHVATPTSFIRATTHSCFACPITAQNLHYAPLIHGFCRCLLPVAIPTNVWPPYHTMCAPEALEGGVVAFWQIMQVAALLHTQPTQHSTRSAAQQYAHSTQPHYTHRP